MGTPGGCSGRDDVTMAASSSHTAHTTKQDNKTTEADLLPLEPPGDMRSIPQPNNTAQTVFSFPNPQPLRRPVFVELHSVLSDQETDKPSVVYWFSKKWIWNGKYFLGIWDDQCEDVLMACWESSQSDKTIASIWVKFSNCYFIFLLLCYIEFLWWIWLLLIKTCTSTNTSICRSREAGRSWSGYLWFSVASSPPICLV